MMYAQMAFSAGQSAFNFLGASSEAKFQQSMQAYRNEMLRIQSAQSMNTITLNEIGAQDAAHRQSLDLQTALLKAEGQAEVASGAAGVNGQSTQAVLTDLRASFARSNYARTENLRQQYIGFNQERRNVGVAAALGQETSVIPTPSVSTALLDFGVSALKIYDRNQPAGDRIADMFVTKNRLFE